MCLCVPAVNAQTYFSTSGFNQCKILLKLVQYSSISFLRAPSLYYLGGSGKDKEIANDKLLELVKIKTKRQKEK